MIIGQTTIAMERSDAALVRWMQRTKYGGRVAKDWLALPYVELDEGHVTALLGTRGPTAIPWPKEPYTLPWPAGIITVAIPARYQPLRRVWWRFVELGECVAVVGAQEGPAYEDFAIIPLGYIERQPSLRLGVHHRNNESSSMRMRTRMALHLGALAAQSLVENDKDNE